jgi:hypothetical protein
MQISLIFSSLQLHHHDNVRRYHGPRRGPEETFGRQNPWIFLLNRDARQKVLKTVNKKLAEKN